MIPTVRVTTVPEGNPGNLVTLSRLRDLAGHPSPAIHSLRRVILQGVLPGSHEALSRLFEWVRAKMTFRRDDPNAEEISTPDRLAWEILNHGRAFGDCDDFVSLLGALQVSAEIPTRLVAVSTHEDRIWNHVYLEGAIGGFWIAEDAIIDERLGWSVPPAEVTSRIEVQVN